MEKIRERTKGNGRVLYLLLRLCAIAHGLDMLGRREKQVKLLYRWLMKQAENRFWKNKKIQAAGWRQRGYYLYVMLGLYVGYISLMVPCALCDRKIG